MPTRARKSHPDTPGSCLDRAREVLIYGTISGMGMYLNEGCRLYRRNVNSEIHVDKSLLIRETNSRIGTEDQYICLSRPRRFGKSMAAHMLMAYYSRGADSRELFKDKKIYSDSSL